MTGSICHCVWLRAEISWPCRCATSRKALQPSWPRHSCHLSGASHIGCSRAIWDKCNRHMLREDILAVFGGAARMRLRIAADTPAKLPTASVFRAFTNWLACQNSQWRQFTCCCAAGHAHLAIAAHATALLCQRSFSRQKHQNITCAHTEGGTPHLLPRDADTGHGRHHACARLSQAE